jgi:hypothetical protein
VYTPLLLGRAHALKSVATAVCSASVSCGGGSSGRGGGCDDEESPELDDEPEEDDDVSEDDDISGGFTRWRMRMRLWGGLAKNKYILVRT